MLYLNNIIRNKSKVLALVLLTITFSILSCTVEVSTQEDIQDVEELRTELSKRFANLEVALKSSDETQIDPIIFKKESLKHLLKVDESAENYDQISKNYDAGFFTVSHAQLEKSTHERPEYISHIDSLSKNLLLVEEFESTKLVFEDFYSLISSSKNLTAEEKNVLISIAAWYEGSINFFEENSGLFLSQEQNQSIAAIHFKGCGWWQKWGKCVAGTIGGYYGGALAGCAVGAGVGTAAAGVGAIPGCAVGAAVGAIGGALTGAAASCDGCDTN